MAHCFRKSGLRILVSLISILVCSRAFCCTSVIISGKARADGRPVMLKHRDAGELNNRMQWFKGNEYSFIGLVNSSSKGGEVWAGTNSAGFSIMNTATYDLKDDDVPASAMDQEGRLMHEALGQCRTVADFERFLDSLPKPWGVETNFGVIDSDGGAAYYEVDNWSWRKFEVCDEPGGLMVVTNFTRSGRVRDRKGVDRFEEATRILAGMDISTIGHKEIFNAVSRSGKPILRESTSASIVFEGVPAGEDPSSTVMWTILGSPANCVYVPLKVFGRDLVPSYMKSGNGFDNSLICGYSLVMKGIYGLHPGCMDNCLELEKSIDEGFTPQMRPLRYRSYTKKIGRRLKLMYLRKMPRTVH